MIFKKLFIISYIFICIQMNFSFASDNDFSNSEFLINVYNLDNLTSSEFLEKKNYTP